MILSKIHLKGYRNFKDAIINFNEKSLIIGKNDVGKTNLLKAMRLLLDRGLSDYDLEPQDSDFYVYENTHKFKITLEFNDVTADCVVSKMKGYVSDDDNMFLSYCANRDEVTGVKSFKLYAGKSLTELQEIEDRFYRKVLNLKYIGSSRDFSKYISKEKNYLFQSAKENRTPEEQEVDDVLYGDIQNGLSVIDEKIPKLNFVSSATNLVNEELKKLSIHHSRHTIQFDSATSSPDNFIRNTSVVSKYEDKMTLVGGDGKLNQIYLAMWANRNGLTENNLSEVSIFCIEEPEAHLHPHQQRKLAEYLTTVLTGQVLITTHSPQISSEFSPNSIIRLFSSDSNGVTAASKGCSEVIEKEFDHFGYRRSVISSEAFFADLVFLVEGPSEEVFYKSLSKNIGIDLDRLNVSILLVDGVGFKTYIKILEALGIEWVLRTDNDVFKIPKKDKYRLAGVERCISVYRTFFVADEDTDEILATNKDNLRWASTKTPPEASKISGSIISKELESYGIYLADIDLEHDLFFALKTDFNLMYPGHEDQDIIESMQNKKATFMFKFISQNSDLMDKLKDSEIAGPLLLCKEIVSA